MTGRPTRRDRTRSVASEIREYALGNLAEVDHADLDETTALVDDDEVRDLLVFAKQAWRRHSDDDAPDFHETDWATRRTERYATAAASEAVRTGNVSVMEYITGMPEYEPDVRGLHAIQRLESWLVYSEAVKVVYLAGHMGNGKTDFAHLMTEVVEHRSDTDDDLAEAEIATNIPSSRYDAITSYPAFKSWVESGEHGSNRWFIFDEASSVLTGYSHDREAVEQLISHLVKLARKYGVNIIIIGHTGMDLHADLRRLCDYVAKESLKTARFYSTVNRGEGEGHLFDLSRLPPARGGLDRPSLGLPTEDDLPDKDAEDPSPFDTDDEAPWSWGDALDGEDDRVDPQDVRRLVAKRGAELYETTEMTQNDVVNLLSDEDLDITRNMLRAARNGEYNEVVLA